MTIGTARRLATERRAANETIVAVVVSASEKDRDAIGSLGSQGNGQTKRSQTYRQQTSISLALIVNRMNT